MESTPLDSLGIIGSPSQQTGSDSRIYNLGPGQVYRYIRNSFMSAGQNSFDNPPAEDQEMFESLINTMPVVRGGLERRWGTVLFAQPLVDIAIRHLGELQNNTSRRLIAVTNGSVAILNESTGTIIGICTIV